MKEKNYKKNCKILKIEQMKTLQAKVVDPATVVESEIYSSKNVYH